MKKYIGRKKGITLIALVITIIILLILAGITISALTNQGLLKNAKEATNRTENAQKEEQELLNQYEDELNNYLSKNDKKEEKLIDKINDGTIKIGDYVKYVPETAKTDSIIQELNAYSGLADNTTSTLTQENLNWRILDIQNGQVRLISEVPTTVKITLKGYNGYNNAVKLLDDTCNTLYNNSKLASKVQNLKMEDIQDKMNETNYSNIYADYGKSFTLSNKYYPNILTKEKQQQVNGISGTELMNSEQTELINQTSKVQANTLELKNIYWRKEMNLNDFKDSKYYELFINNGTKYPTYWLSSRSITVSSIVAGFNMQYISNANVIGITLYYTDGNEDSRKFAYRPIVTLNTDVLIETENSRDGSTAEQAYLIK